MASIESTVRINRPIEEVFEFVADPATLPQWQTGLVDSAVTSEGPTAVGTTYRQKFDLFGRQFETAGVITEYEPPSQYSFKATSGSFPVDGGFSFAAVWGGTRITFSGELRQSGVARLSGRLLTPMIQTQFEESFGRLKEVLEAEPESAS